MSTIEEAVAAADNIEGWMRKSELVWLAEQASKRKLIVEVGSWQGKSSKAMAMTAVGKLFCVDPWNIGRHTAKLAPEFSIPDGLFLKFKENLASEILTTRVCPMRMHSVDAAKEITHFTDGKLLDMVFIDADHRYRCVAQDITTWRNLIASGGILCGHDYAPDHPGVIKAVDELIKDKEIIPNTSIWVLKVQ
jgi:predicted O-methyltransferase YrrM